MKRKGESWEGFTIRKEGDANHFQNRHSSAISTHTLRKEGDIHTLFDIFWFGQFQPTPSARRVTTFIPKKVCLIIISTHTLRKEGD